VKAGLVSNFLLSSLSVLPSVKVACEEGRLTCRIAGFPNRSTKNDAAYSVYERLPFTRPKLPDILSCQAEARRLFFTRSEVLFHRFPGAQIFINKSLLIRCSRKYFVNGKAAAQQLCAACEAEKKRIETLYSAKVRLAKCDQHT